MDQHMTVTDEFIEAFPDARADVIQTIRRIRTSPFIPHTDDVRGFVYDVRTGSLEEVLAS